MEELTACLTERDNLDLEQIIVQELIQENQPLTEIVGTPGAHGKVYRLTDNYVVKVLWDRAHIKKGVEHEFFIACELCGEGISVPKPIGLFDVEVKEGSSIYNRKGFVMAFVPDSNVYGYKKCVLKRRLNRELRKCKRLGFDPLDPPNFVLGKHNVLYDKKQDKLYLIDFYHWQRK